MADGINQAPPEQEAALLEAGESRVPQAFIAGGRTYLGLVNAYVRARPVFGRRR